MRDRSRLLAVGLILSLLGAIAHTGCSRNIAGPQEALLRTEAELAESVPDEQDYVSRTWYVEKTPALGASLIQLDRLSRLERRPGWLRIFVLSGDMRIRVGGEERVLGAGSYASIPPRMPYRLLRERRRRLRYIALLMPESTERYALEELGPLPRRNRLP